MWFDAHFNALRAHHLRDRPLEKLWGGGWGIFEPQFSNGPSLNNARKDMTQHKDESEVGEPITCPSLSCSEKEVYRMF